MIASLTQLLDHYANRIGIMMQPHPQGAQLTISVMPCPSKVKDEALRQQLIEPIVIVGDNESLMQQLQNLEQGLSVATSNEQVNQPVQRYLDALKTATSDKPKQEIKDTAKPAKPVVKNQNSAAPPVSSPANAALDDMFL